MRIETDSDYYYDVITIYDRLCNEILKRYPSIYTASKSIGKSKGYLYSPNTLGSVQNLHTLCKQFDIDFEYMITGKNNRGKFYPSEIDLKKLYDTYCLKRYTVRHSDSIKVIMHHIKQGKKNIKLATLFNIADLYKLSPLSLIY